MASIVNSIYLKGGSVYFRKKRSRVAIAAASMSILAASCSAAGASDAPEEGQFPSVEIVNPGFEDDLSGWIQVEPVNESEIVNSGEGAAKVPSAGGMLSQDVAVEANTTYRLTASLQGVGRIGATVGGQTTIAESTLSPEADPDAYEYQERSLDFETGESTSVTIFATYAAGEARYDDFSLIRLRGADDPDPDVPGPDEPPTDSTTTVPSTDSTTTMPSTDPTTTMPGDPDPDPDPTTPAGDVNLVFNGTFENDVSGWSQVEPASPSNDANTDVGAGKVEEGGRLSQTIAVAPGEDYSLSAMIKIEGDMANVGSSGIVVGSETIEFEPREADVYEAFGAAFNSGESTEVTIFFEGGDIRMDDVELNGPAPAGWVDPDDVFDWSIWALEGQNPLVGDTFEYKALEECVMTPNGNGCRHENKIIQSERYPCTQQYEHFKASITPTLSDGAETIVLQWHPEGLATLGVIYVADINENAEFLKDKTDGSQWLDLVDGEAGNGIFDVIFIAREPGAGALYEAGELPTRSYGGSFQEQGFGLGTITSGETFEVDAIMDHGVFTFNTVIGGVERTDTLDTDESPNCYLKWGSYAQARPSDTLERPLTTEEKETMTIEEKEAIYRAYYTDSGITEADVVFENVEYERQLDPDAVQVVDSE